MSEVTALPTVPQPLPKNFILCLKRPKKMLGMAHIILWSFTVYWHERCAGKSTWSCSSVSQVAKCWEQKSFCDWQQWRRASATCVGDVRRWWRRQSVTLVDVKTKKPTSSSSTKEGSHKRVLGCQCCRAFFASMYGCFNLLKVTSMKQNGGASVYLVIMVEN